MSELQRERELFSRCLELPTEERHLVLEQECSGKPKLRERVLRLIEAHQAAASQKSRIESVALTHGYEEEIDGFKVLQVLDEGGMGIVLLAEQSAPIQRKVAIKIIKPGMDTREVLARFEFEKRALAMMSHPNIAQIISAGQTRGGLPYFVLEYVPGWPITSYCDSRKLSLHERLRLFESACLAVQHAHQRGIIHRDIKPANILVYDDHHHAKVKIIDFGIAKAVFDHASEATLHTRGGDLMGTPEYMSPEQADPFNFDVDTRTDVYSLGAVLYRLLTGRTPLNLAQKHSYAEVQQSLSQQDPARPSVRVRQNETPAAEPGTFGFETRGLHARALKRDLDWICLKALRKNRNERYASPAELAQDIRSYLDLKPIKAAPPGRAQDAWKLLRRNKSVSTLSALLIVLIAAFAANSYRQFQALEDERDRARLQFEIAHQVSNFLVTVFQSGDPEHGGHRELSAETILQNAERKLLHELPQATPARALIFVTLANVYSNMGKVVEAESFALRGVSDAEAVFGKGSAEYLDAQWALLRIWSRLGKWWNMLERIPRMVAMYPERNGETSVIIMKMQAQYAIALMNMGRPQLAVERLERVVAQLSRVVGLGDKDTLSTMNQLALAYRLAGRFDESLALMLKALPVFESKLGAEHDFTLGLKYNIAVEYARRGETAYAGTLLRDLLQLRQRLYGENHPATLMARAALIDLLPDDTAKLRQYDEIVAAQTAALGAMHRATLASRLHRALAHWRVRQDAKMAVDEAMAIIDALAPQVPGGYPDLQQAQLLAADALLALQRIDEARRMLNLALAAQSDAEALARFPALQALARESGDR